MYSEESRFKFTRDHRKNIFSKITREKKIDIPPNPTNNLYIIQTILLESQHLFCLI